MGERLTKAQHPLTPLLEGPDGYIPKRYVENMNGYFRYLRPFWRASWGCWCVRDSGPQEIFRIPGGFTVNRPPPPSEAEGPPKGDSGRSNKETEHG